MQDKIDTLAEEIEDKETKLLQVSSFKFRKTLKDFGDKIYYA